MPVEEFNIAEMLQLSLVSFEADAWEFKFRRAVPVAIYVEAGDNSGELGRRIAAEVQEVLKEYGYGETQDLGHTYGSFFQLNLNRSKEAEDGPSFAEKLSGIKNGLISRLKKVSWKETAKIAGSTVTVVVAIGTVVAILSATPVTLAVGSFVIPAKLWLVFGVAGEGVSLVGEAKNILVHSQAALKALKEGEQPKQEEAAPAPTEEITGESMQITYKRLQEIEEEVKGLRERLKNLKKQ